MIAAVTGRLEAQAADYVIVNVGGVSFRVYVPPPQVQACGNVGDTIALYTHLHVREDALTLYGFLQATERDFFETLLTVSGVGPKVALSLLSALPPTELQAAISNGDVNVLTRIPGVGKKTATRLVLDLKGKLDLRQVTTARAGSFPINDDVLAALTNLGYPLAAAQDAVQHLPSDTSLTVADKIRLALRYLAGR